MRTHFLWALALLAQPAIAAERKLDFGEVREGQMPPGFRSAVTGQGKPGNWQVILDETPSLFPPLTPGAPGQATYTAPVASPGPGTQVTIRAMAAGLEDGTATITLA